MMAPVLIVQAIDGWVEQINQLLVAGKEVVLVSSGAVAEGHSAPRLETAPRELFTNCRPPPPWGRWGLFKPTRVAFNALIV